MNSKIVTFSLDFRSFSLEFDVWLQYSLEWTKSLSIHGNDFVFAVADTWLRLNNTRYLIASEDNPGNFIETLKELSPVFRNPIVIPNIEKIIPLGGWCAWMNEYWNRLKNDCFESDDETNYKILIPASLIEGREGRVAAYRYNNVPTIEVGTRPEKGDLINTWCEFNPETVAHQIEQLKYSIIATIQDARTKLNIN